MYIIVSFVFFEIPSTVEIFFVLSESERIVTYMLFFRTKFLIAVWWIISAYGCRQQFGSKFKQSINKLSLCFSFSFYHSLLIWYFPTILTYIPIPTNFYQFCLLSIFLHLHFISCTIFTVISRSMLLPFSTQIFGNGLLFLVFKIFQVVLSVLSSIVNSNVYLLSDSIELFVWAFIEIVLIDW